MMETDQRAMFFRAQVGDWSVSHPRPFPWRACPAPYATLMAEMMLRRTRAEQVAPVFGRFLSLYPDSTRLAAAPPDEVADVLRPLGLKWRLPAFRLLAGALLERHDGAVPADPEQLRALPGVGDYVAAAVMIFAFDRPVTLADTNTVRVAARYFGFPYHAESRRNRVVRTHVDLLLDASMPRRSGYALLDFAAIVCRARTPRCAICPVSERCTYYGANQGQLGVEVGCT